MSHSVSDRYRRLSTRFDAIVQSLSADDLDRPTPCDGWTVRDIVQHVADTEHDLLVARELASGDAEGWAATRAKVQAVLDDDSTREMQYDGWFGPTTLGATIDAFYSMDLMVHGWDIAVAVGSPAAADADPEDVAIARALLEPAGDAMRMPGICGPEVAVPSAATDWHRFLGWTGRNPAWAG